MAATAPELRPHSIHRVPRARLVQRLDEIVSVVAGRSVIDLGFVDEGEMGAKRGRGIWLHEVVRRHARSCVGVDADERGVALARELGFDAVTADVSDPGAVAALGLEPAEVVLAGELLEHLDRPGDFLEAVKALVAPGGALVLTTPNAHALTNVLGALAGGSSSIPTTSPAGPTRLFQRLPARGDPALPCAPRTRRRHGRRGNAHLMLSVVSAAYDEAGVLPSFVARLTTVLRECGEDWEVVLVDDGSRDATWAAIEAAAAAEPRVRGIRLSRNFGHQLALTAGLSVAAGDGVITIDSDLQHPPEAIPALLAAAAGGYDVVYAVRSSADAAGFWKRFTARVFYRTLNRLSSLELPEGAADYRWMSRRIVDVLDSMPERHRFLRGLVRWTGYRQTFVEYERGAREGGESKYGLRKMVLFAWDAVVSFSSFPLRAASVLGAAVSILGWLYLVYVLGVKVFTDNAVAGWTSVTAAVLLLGGVQLVFLGILGQYVGRMYDESSSGRSS